MTDQDIEVWIVEDNVFFRDTIVELFARQPGMRCTLAAGSCEEALAELKRGRVPQVLLMDLELPGMSGLEGIGRVKTISPASQVIVLTVHEDNDKVFEALCAGACGYLLKPASAERIVEAVDTALRGGAPMNAFIARKVLDVFVQHTRPRADYGLTEREREILQLLVDAHSQKQIARTLFLSPHTVDTHLRNIYAKLHVHSRAGAVAKALQERLI
ncbi:MAG: response regulator [Longimicrobiales bacterium]